MGLLARYMSGLCVAVTGLCASGWLVLAPVAFGYRGSAPHQTAPHQAALADRATGGGLAVVSLFVQRGDLAAAMPGWRQITVRGRTVYSVDPDDRSFAWSADGFVYTVIADAPDGRRAGAPAGPVAVLPAWETLPFERVSPETETMGRISLGQAAWR